MTKVIALTFLSIALCSCGKATSQSLESTPIELYGTYQFSSLKCYNSSGSVVASYKIDANSAYDRITISGNSFEMQRIGSNCQTSEEGDIKHVRTSINYGRVTRGAVGLQTNTGSVCTLNYSFTKEFGADVTINAWTRSITPGQSFSISSEFKLVSGSNNYAVLSFMHLDGQPAAALCYEEYSPVTNASMVP